MAGTAILNVKILTDASDAAKGMDDVGSRAGKMKAGIQSAALPAAAALAAVGAAAISAGKAAAEDAASQGQLALAMKNATGANDKQVAAMEDYITKTSKAAAVSDDELRPAMGTLLRATGDAKKSQEAMNTALDVSAATGKSVEQVSTALAKGYAGNTSALGRLVPGLDDATVKSGDMNAIMAELAKTTGGAAAEAADSTAGKMKGMQIAMDEAQESIGAALLPAMSSLATIAAKLADAIGAHPRIFLAIGAAIAVVAGAILAANAAIAIYNTVTTIAGIVSASAWAAALGPILLVAAAVAAVIAVVILLWKKSETFREIVLGVWAAIKKAIEFVSDAIEELIGWIARIKIPGFIKTEFDIIKTAVGFVIDKVSNLIDWIGRISVPNVIKNAFDNIKDAVTGVWNKVIDLIQKIKDITIPEFIKNTFDNIKEAIQGAVTKVGDLITKIGNISIPGAIKTAVEGITGAVQTLAGWIQTVIDKIANIDFPSPPKWLSKVIPGSFAASAPTVAPTLGARALRPTTTATASGGITINVTGAVDPEATARQIRRILAGHDRRIGGIAVTA